MTTSTTQPDLIPADAKVVKLACDLKFTEGPVWSDADGGFLVFSDIPADELKRWDAHGLSTYRKPSHQINGNTRSPAGDLVSCSHAMRRVEIERDGKVDVLIDSYRGKKFNSPNDLVVKSDGTVWFTDPPYGLPKGQTREIDKQCVFRFDPATKQVDVVADDFDMPNGLCFSPDESKLYIADSGKPHHIREFKIADGKLVDGRVFCTIDKGIPDGIRCDETGNVWSSAGDGVHVFSPAGELLLKISVPETPANLCFGGADHKTLFITARTSLYSIQTNVRGPK
jgi:gluconolactonase